MADDWRARLPVMELTKQKKKKLLILPVPGLEDRFYHFHNGSPAGRLTQTWYCTLCQAYKKKHRLPNSQNPSIGIEVENGVARFRSNPDIPNHLHVCTPVVVTQHKAKQAERVMLKKAETDTRLKPKQIYIDAKAAVMVESPEVCHAMAPYNSLKSQVSRAKRRKFEPVLSIHEIPENLMYTLEDSLHPPQPPRNPAIPYIWHISAPQEPNCLLFGSQIDFEALHEGDHWILDGTFKYCPQGFSQLYSIHSFYMNESRPSIVALLHNREGPTYTDLFTRVRNELLNRFGTVGAIAHGTANFDFERAAYRQFGNVFAADDVTIRGCAFHYAQCLDRGVTRHNLARVYGRRGEYAADRYSGVHTWIRKLVALCVHHPDYVRNAWENSLRFIPVTGDAAVDARLRAFRNYYRDEWMVDDKIPVWNHHFNLGPRTSNHAEGWHSSLDQHFDFKHPTMRKFLPMFQKLHMAVQERYLELRDGHAPNRTRPQYIINNARLRELIVNTRQVLVGIEQGYMDHHGRPRAELVAEHTDNFLRTAGHLLGDHITVPADIAPPPPPPAAPAAAVIPDDN